MSRKIMSIPVYIPISNDYIYELPVHYNCVHVRVRADVTGVHVGAKGEGAVLHVKREAEDLQVTGGDQPQHAVPADVSRVVEVDVGTPLGDIVVHTEHTTHSMLP